MINPILEIKNVACSLEIQKAYWLEKQGLHLEKIASDLPVTYVWNSNITCRI